jgi:phage tail sheath gpL-like
MPISFDDIPDYRVPFTYIEFDPSKATQGPAILNYRQLIIGQKLVAGSASTGDPVLVTSEGDAINKFGQGSMLHQMAKALFANNTFNEAWFAALDDDGSAAAASGSVQYSGTASSAGTVNLYIAGYRVKAGVSSGDTASDVATAVADAINANGDLPVTASASTDTVTITARNAGEAANFIDIRHNYFSDQELPDGITASITAMSGGATNPDVQAVIDAIGDDWYQVWAMPYSDSANLTKIKDELERRWGPDVQIEGVAFTATTGTVSEQVNEGGVHNSQFLSIMDATDGTVSPPYEWAVAVCGVVAKHGQIDPARPFQTLKIEHIKAEKPKDRRVRSERNTLLNYSIATHTVDDQGGQVRIERLITTYSTNDAGAEDTAYLDVNSVLTLGYLRWDFRVFWLSKYPRHKLGQDSKRYDEGQAIMTPKLARSEAITRFRQWEELALVEDAEQFKRDLIVERNASDLNRLDFLMPPNLINQLRVTAAKVAFRL